MKKLPVIICFLLSLIYTSCHKDATQTSDLMVFLQDASASAYEKIKVEVKGVSVYSQSSGGWVSLTVSNGTFDLLTLDSSHQAFLGKIKLSEGDITDLQLTIGNQNTVTVGGISYPLVLDASDLDKLKVKIGQHVNGSSFYKLTIDFKASESIDGNGGIYKLKASLKISLKEV